MDRVRALDGLRALAILIVMVSHAGLKKYVPGGLGVTIFFFLSGYLITTLLLLEWQKSGTIDFTSFYIRRSVRIIPPMLIAIGVALLLAALGLGDSINVHGLPLDLLFLTNYYASHSSNVPIPLWSLDVEEHFYLVFPLLFALAVRQSPKATLGVVLSGLVAVLLLRVQTYGTAGESNMYFWTHTRIDSILYGCLLAVFNNPVLAKRVWLGPNPAYFVAGGALVVFTLVYRDSFIRETWRYSIQGIGLFLIFNYALRSNGIVNRVLSLGQLKVVADYSYVLYLIHYPLMVAADKALGGTPHVLRSAAAVGAAFLFAAVMRRFVELPLLAWRKAYQQRLSLPSAMVPKGVE